MRNAAPFVGNPDVLILSIAALEARIHRRHRNIRNLATACGRDIKVRMTSWPVLVTAGVSGFLIGRHGAQSGATPKTDTDNSQPTKLSRALKFTLRVFNAFHYLPR